MRSPITTVVAFLAAAHALTLSDDVTIHEDGVVEENNATHSHLIVQKLYSDQVNIEQQSTFSLKYGAIYFAGYYAFIGGATQIRTAIDDCKSLNDEEDGLKCFISVSAAAMGNVGSALIGGIGGNGHMAWVANVARNAAFNPGNEARDLFTRQTCPKVNPFITNGYFPGGNKGVKISAKLACFNLNPTVVSDAQELIKKMPQKMLDNSAWQIQGTFYDPTQPNGNTAWFRVHYSIQDSHPTNCPHEITGSGCAFDP